MLFNTQMACVENEIKLRVKCMCFDMGRENCEFENFFAESDIKMEMTIHRTSHLNGVVKKMNYIFCKRASCMQLHVDLPKGLWVETINTTVYLANRFSFIPLNIKLHEEVLSVKDISLLAMEATRWAIASRMTMQRS